MESLFSSIVGNKLSEKKAKDTSKRYHVRMSDKKVVTAYKNQNGPGYVYHKRTTSGTKNVLANNNLYKTSDEAKKKAERLKKESISKKPSRPKTRVKQKPGPKINL